VSAASRRVLVVGKGAREHALAERLLAAPEVGEVIVAPGNAGTRETTRAELRGKRLRNAEGNPLQLARELRPDLVVVGPEAPLVEGLVDELGREGILAYGPSRAAARLEGSKAFFKEFAVASGINTPRHHTVQSESEAARAIADFPAPPVVKADGLCAGKGVIVPDSHAEAVAAAREMLSGRAFGDAGRTVVLEERVFGSELSVHAICDGSSAHVLPFVQDHKRIGEGDTGPNTGGMGTYGPVALPDPALAARIRQDIVERVVGGMAARGTPFRGTFFGNLMLVPGAAPTLFEINVRFGDPETQVLTNVLDVDWFELLSRAARGELGASSSPLRATGSALCVVLAAEGYPGEPRQGDAISGLDEAMSQPGVRVYHAGTSWRAGQILTAGGRVLGVTGAGENLKIAHARAYAGAAAISFRGKQLRRDIGHQAFEAGSVLG
jgi:phosphoribosylamine--glycine ligase